MIPSRRKIAASLALLLIAHLLPLTPAAGELPPVVSLDPSVVSLDPLVTFVGGSPTERETIIDAIDRYVGAGLGLPNLEVRIHASMTGCKGKQGLFHPSTDKGVIDLCFDREFLALHELGHAWEHFNLDDADRDEFGALVKADSWAGSDSAWHRRGIEMAAEALAHGLMSVPLETTRHLTREFERFQALTGRPSPRLLEMLPPKKAAPALTGEELAAAAAYNNWRQATAG